MTIEPRRVPRTGPARFTGRLTTEHHRAALTVLLVVVIAHWAEHLVQAYQIWGLGWSRPEARGVLGMPFPWLIESEWLHYGYALLMLAGIWLVRGGFRGRAKTWWTITLGIQVWHHVEHLLLLLQALTGQHLAGRAAPTSIAQLIFPRVELHLFYNAAVFLPMIVAMYLHLRPNAAERAAMLCDCVRGYARQPA